MTDRASDEVAPPADPAAAEASRAPDSPSEAAVLEPPPAPPGPDVAGLTHPVGVAGRSVALAFGLGAALVAWIQLTFQAKWVARFVIENDVASDARMLLLKSMGVGGAIAAAAAVAAIVWVRRRGGDARAVERWLWLCSPLVLLPAVPILFRWRAWKDRHAQLLPAVLVTALVFELFFHRALVEAPERARAAWRWLGARLRWRVLRHAPLVTVLLGSAGYGALTGFYTVRWHHKLQTHMFDLGINTHLLFASLHGKHMWSTLVFPKEPEKYLANHAKFGQYLLAPIFAVFPRAEVLLIAQCVMLGLGAIPLFLFARRRLPPWVAALVALGWLCWYPMHAANFYEVNYITMAGSLVLATVWAADAGRWIWFGILFFWTLVFREDMPIGLAIVGTVFWLSGRRPKLGLFMAVVSTLWFGFLRFHWMEEAGDWWFPSMYKGLWPPGETGFRSVLKTLLSNPYFVLDKIWERDKAWYLMHLLVPVAFLPARRWWAWAAFVPGTILTLLATDYRPLTMFTFQYVMHWAPYLFLATVLVLAALARDQGQARMRAGAAALVLATAATTYNLGVFPQRTETFKGGYFPIGFEYTEEERTRYRQLRELIALLPADASVAATENSGPHLVSRLYAFTMRNGPQTADWIVASSRELGLEKTRPTLKEAVSSGRFGVVERRGDFALFRRGHDTAGNAQLIADWKL
ncbi:MAG: DUF2079 domain-containing protein [Polyangiaceae bacterium]|nr:DUF2079 domain-containing protein [Polyangiaceae bacterium]